MADNPQPVTGWRRIFQPLASRKTRVALATVIAAYAAQYGLGVSEEVLITILGVGISLILGIAHEDNGAKRVASNGTAASSSADT